MSDLVVLHVEPPAEPRDRLRALARPILLIPHALLVGGPLLPLPGLGAVAFRTGALGFLAVTIAFLDWFAILFWGHPIAGLAELKRLYLRWRTRLLVYGCFVRDEYPPFGEAPYPATLDLPDEPAARDRVRVGLRPLLLLPHLFVVIALMLALLVVTIVAWVMLSVTARLSPPIWRFSRDAIAYVMRVEAYALLVHDQFPSFRLSARETSAFGEPSTQAR
jgi:hypothetical protein